MRLREGVEGLIPKEEFDEVGANAKVGQNVKCEVTSLDTVDRRLFLTMKNIGAERPAGRPQKKYEADNQTGGTLGDLIKEKLGKLDLK